MELGAPIDNTKSMFFLTHRYVHTLQKYGTLKSQDLEDDKWLKNHDFYFVPVIDTSKFYHEQKATHMFDELVVR